MLALDTVTLDMALEGSGNGAKWDDERKGKRC